MKSDRVTEQREDGKCEGKKSPEMVAAERGWKEPECPPQAGGRTTAPPPTLSNLILTHFLSKLRRKALITSALCSRYLIIPRSYRMNAPPPPPLFFLIRGGLVFPSREPMAPLVSRWEMSSHAQKQRHLTGWLRLAVNAANAPPRSRPGDLPLR